MDKPTDLEQLRRDADQGGAVAQYNLGVWHVSGEGGGPNPVGAHSLFLASAGQGYAPAQSALGYMHLMAQGLPYDPREAVRWFAAAADQDYAEAQYRLGELRATGLGTTQDLAAARAGFRRAAQAGHAPAQCQLAYCLEHGLGGAPDPAAATEWYLRAARAGHGRAQACIARRYELGETLARDGLKALRWYLRAQRSAYQVCADSAVQLEAGLSETLRAQARVALEDLEDVDAPDAARYPPIAIARQSHPVSEQPRIAVFEEFLTAEECWHLAAQAAPYLRPSKVLKRVSGEAAQSAGRRSGGMSFSGPLRDVVIWNIENRLADACGLPIEHGEPLHILHYGPGDEYRPHHDYFDPAVPGRAAGLAHGGQRLATLLVYLNEVAEGGETVFPDIGARVTPSRGRALLFYNCRPDGKLDPLTRHAGAPVRGGEKWVASKWIRERNPLEKRRINVD